MGQRYIEPADTVLLKNEMTGDTCTLEYKSRSGWGASKKDISSIEGKVSDPQGNLKYRLLGKFTEQIVAQNVESKEEWVVFTAPELPENRNLMFNMNFFSL